MLATFVPLADHLPRRRARLLRAVTALLGLTLIAIVVTTAAVLASGAGTAVAATVLETGPLLVYLVVAVLLVLRAALVREGRTGWATIAAGVTLTVSGTFVYELGYGGDAPIPSLADVLFLALYPLAYVGMVLLAREEHQRTPAGVWLDGIIAGLAVAALGAALVFDELVAASAGADVAETATNLAYPVADLLLAALVLGLLALRNWRVDAAWGMLGGGFLAMCLADLITLADVAGGAATSGPVANVFFIVAATLIALAAWQPPTPAEAPRLDGATVLLAPGAFTLLALGVMIYDHFERLDSLAFGLATLTVIAGVARTALTFRDVREVATARHLAVTDDLTSLPNRRLLQRRLAEAVEAERDSRRELALLVIDLDRFKELNDTLGHHAGDALLRQVGPRLAAVLRAGDTLARLGGDEFGVLLAPPLDPAVGQAVAERIRAELERPFEVLDLQLHVSASVGVAVFPHHGADADELLRHADAAMYSAKATGGGYEVYSHERDNNSRERLELISDLRRALADGDLEVHFQPKVRAATREVAGVEALARWRHPERGAVSPAVFVPLAEQAGLARPMTRHVLDLALARLCGWLADHPHLHVAVNVTATDLLDARLPDEVADALARHGVPASALVIEVTETSVLSDPIRIGDVLRRLRALGVGLALDDFGTGYSSLTHLRSLPVTEVKIDRGFVARMGSDVVDRAIVRSTIGLSHDVGKCVVAEGIEDETTWQLLADMGCELIQGYAFAAPMPGDELTALLAGEPLAATA